MTAELGPQTSPRAPGVEHRTGSSLQDAPRYPPLAMGLRLRKVETTGEPGGAMRDAIRLVNMHFYGHHGVGEAERDLGGRFSFDIELIRDLTRPGETDDLQDTVDYKAVYDLVADVQRRGFHLLEAVVHNIALEVLARFPVEEVTVRARKQSVPLGGLIDYTEVEITRRATDQPRDAGQAQTQGPPDEAPRGVQFQFR